MVSKEAPRLRSGFCYVSGCCKPLLPAPMKLAQALTADMFRCYLKQYLSREQESHHVWALTLAWRLQSEWERYPFLSPLPPLAPRVDDDLRLRSLSQTCLSACD